MALYHEVSGDGPPLLLIHGTGAAASSWEPAIPFFAKERRVIHYDRHGFSRSLGKPHGKHDYFRRHADDAAALLSELSIPSASVLGWSAGGIVALSLAIHHPGLVGKLVLYEPPLWARRHMPLAMLLGFLKIMLNRALGRKRRAAEAFFRMALAEQSGENAYDRLDEKTREELLANADPLFAELDAGTGEELSREAVQGLRCPTALLIGGKSAPFLRSAAERLFTLQPSWTPLRIAEANHIFLREQPQRFTEIVLPHL
jgi:pimeloyl-ACP methyl ester carboxylesterase